MGVIDLRSQASNNVIVIPVEHDQKNANTRRETQKPLLGEAIWLDLPVFKRSHSLLLFPIAAIERCQIEI